MLLGDLPKLCVALPAVERQALVPTIDDVAALAMIEVLGVQCTVLLSLVGR